MNCAAYEVVNGLLKEERTSFTTDQVKVLELLFTFHFLQLYYSRIYATWNDLGIFSKMVKFWLLSGERAFLLGMELLTRELHSFRLWSLLLNRNLPSQYEASLLHRNTSSHWEASTHLEIWNSLCLFVTPTRSGTNALKCIIYNTIYYIKSIANKILLLKL